MALLFATTAGGGGSGGSIKVTDGTTTVTNVTEIDFTSGVSVSNLGGGTAGASVTANIDGGSSTSVYLVTSQQLNGGNA